MLWGDCGISQKPPQTHPTDPTTTPKRTLKVLILRVGYPTGV